MAIAKENQIYSFTLQIYRYIRVIYTLKLLILVSRIYMEKKLGKQIKSERIQKRPIMAKKDQKSMNNGSQERPI